MEEQICVSQFDPALLKVPMEKPHNIAEILKLLVLCTYS